MQTETQEIVTVALTVTVNRSEYDSPTEWDWGALLDLAPEESVTVTDATAGTASLAKSGDA